MDEQKIELEQIDKSLKDIDRAIKTINKGQNPELKKLINTLNHRAEKLYERKAWLKSRVEGSWLNPQGWITRGKFEGLYIVPLLKACAESAWDYPSTMERIISSVGDPEFLSNSFSMYPEDYFDGPEGYGILINLAPEANWDQMKEVVWDT